MDTAGKNAIMILGTGPEARVALDVALSLDILVFGFLTDDVETQNQEINDLLVIAALGTSDADTLLSDENMRVVVAQMDGQARKDMVAQLGGGSAQVEGLLHPQHDISSYSQLGIGNVLLAGTTIMSNSVVGDYNWIGAGVSIGPDSVVGNYCTIEDGARIGKNVRIADEARIGAGAIIYAGVEIGPKAMIAAGAVVLQDIPEQATVFGNPAQVVEAD